MMSRLLLSCLKIWLGILIAPLALAQVTPQELKSISGPKPLWVKDHPLDLKAESTQKLGVWYRLSDVQINIDEATEYRRIVYKIEDAGSLSEYAQIQVAYEPSLEDIAFHGIFIHRHGQTIEAKDPRDFRIYDNESSAQNKIYSGTKNIDINLRGVVVGDTIDYAFSRRKKPGIFQKVFSREYRSQYSLPLEHFRIRVLTRPDQKIYSRNSDPSLTETKSPTESTWTAMNLPGVANESRVRSYHYPRLSLSTLASWSEFVDFILPLYADGPLPAALQDKIASWQKLTDPKAKLKEAATFVQRDIRYLSLSIGSHGWQPHTPESVVKNGYGDCKDKSFLLHLILKDLGIESAVALVNSGDGVQPAIAMPGTHQFDHAIVYAKIDAVPYWIDATDESDQGRFIDYPPIFGDALLLRPGETTLVAMKPREDALPELEIDDRFTVNSPTVLQLDRKKILRGRSASRFNAEIKSRGEPEFSKYQIDRLSAAYGPTEALKPTEIVNNPDGSVLLKSSYRIQPKLNNGEIFLSLSLIPSESDTFVETGRHFPLVLDFPVFAKQSMTIVGEKISQPQTVTANTPFYRAYVKWSQMGKDLVAEYSYRSLAHEIPADQIKTYSGDMEKLRGVEGFRFRPGSPPSPEPSSNENMILGFVIIGFVGLILVALAIGIVKFVARRPVKTRIGEGPDRPFLYQNEAELKHWLNEKICVQCRSSRMTTGNTGDVLLNEVTMHYFDQECLLCKSQKTFYVCRK